MKPHTDISIAMELLLDFQKFVKSISLRGPSELTVFTENFAAKLMEVYYARPFVNMNYATKNIAGIDLLNKESNHGIQFTIQDNSADKIIKTAEKASNYDQLTIFFFSVNKTNTVVRHVMEKGKWKDNIEVISLVDAFSSMEQDAAKATKYREICELWINGKTSNYCDFISKFNNALKMRIESNIRSKKYIPEIYIPEIDLKNSCRNFVDPEWSTQLLLYKIPTYYVGYCYDFIKETNVELKDGTKVSFEKDCDVLPMLHQKNPVLNMTRIINKLKNYMYIAGGTTGGTKIFDQNGKEYSINDKFSFYENSLYYKIKKDLQEYEFSNKKYFFIVKDAGQGKTNFLCDFSENVLVKRKIPTIFLNVNELTKNLLDTVKDQIATVVGQDFYNALNIVEQCCTIANKVLLICLDGLNENSNLHLFVKEVLELFRFAEAKPFLKIIATTRNKAYESFFKDFENESFGELIATDIEENKVSHSRKSESFEKKIYKKYRKYFNITCNISSAARKKLSNDTLLLRIFSEVFENDSSSIVNDIYLYKMFDAYIKKREQQLFHNGMIKREGDLGCLLYKISCKMIETHNLSGFTYDGFTPEEKDLLDLIVQEDIIIKSSDNNGITFFDTKISFSFTYDEFRDYLLASTVLKMNDDIFEKEIDTFCNEAERYDGVLRFLFLFYKTKSVERLSVLKKHDAYQKIYSENIFSVEDQFLSTKDVAIIKKALKDKYVWVYYEVIKRLDVTQYKNLSVKDIVEVYIEYYTEDPNWDRIFTDIDEYYKEKGILRDLLEEKIDDTAESEMFGILLLLCTIGFSESKDKYLTWLLIKYPEQYKLYLSEIRKEYSELKYRAECLLEEEVE